MGTQPLATEQELELRSIGLQGRSSLHPFVQQMLVEHILYARTHAEQKYTQAHLMEPVSVRILWDKI